MSKIVNYDAYGNEVQPEKNNRAILEEVNRHLLELGKKDNMTPAEILEVTKEALTGYANVPEDYEWPKVPDDWLNSENFQAKHDEGKLQLRLVPPQIIRDIAEVRMYGNAKYGDPDNWKTVEKWRYIDALYRHFLLYLEDPEGVDEESGIKHYKHMACNMAFICAMEKKDESKSTDK